MVKIESSVMIDCPAKEVWKFITDPSNSPKIDPAILEEKREERGRSRGRAHKGHTGIGRRR